MTRSSFGLRASGFRNAPYGGFSFDLGCSIKAGKIEKCFPNLPRLFRNWSEIVSFVNKADQVKKLLEIVEDLFDGDWALENRLIYIPVFAGGCIAKVGFKFGDIRVIDNGKL